MNFELPQEEIAKLEETHKSIQDKKIADRIKSVVALAKGYSFEQIEQILLIDERTVRRYFIIYKGKGVDGLLTLNYKGGISKLSGEQEKELCKHLEENLYSTAQEICDYIKKQYDIDYTPEGLVIALHRLGFSYHKTKIIPAKADREKQEQFLQKYEKLKEEKKPDEKIYFIDGVHPTHNVMPAYGWIKKGEDKEVRSNTGRERVNINGAYSPDDNDIIVRKDETINAQSSIELLKMIEEKNPNMSKIYVIADNAKYYSAILVKEYLKTSKIVFMHLPSYSPNLNLIERLWKFFKKKVMYNRFYENKQAFENAIDDFFSRGVIGYREDIKRLLAENFHLFNTA